jgi:hypothetical protein
MSGVIPSGYWRRSGRATVCRSRSHGPQPFIDAAGQGRSSLRSIRRFRPDPIPIDDIRLIVKRLANLAAATNSRAVPVVNDRERIRDFARVPQAWAKRA